MNTVFIGIEYSKTSVGQVLIVMHHSLQEYSTKVGGSTSSIILQFAHVSGVWCQNPIPLVFLLHLVGLATTNLYMYIFVCLCAVYLTLWRQN
jgi:hypothetical protein